MSKLNDEDKMLLQLNHKWTLYILTMDRENKNAIFIIAKQFNSNWTTMHKRFQLVAKILDFSTCKRDNTLVGYYYYRRGGDCLFCLPDKLQPEDIYG